MIGDFVPDTKNSYAYVLMTKDAGEGFSKYLIVGVKLSWTGSVSYERRITRKILSLFCVKYYIVFTDNITTNWFHTYVENVYTVVKTSIKNRFI